MFGHERGAFTGAVNAKLGLMEVADRGTVFLDEIGDIDLTVQPKLLKVLETRQFRRLGDVHDRTVDIRLISATHRDLRELVREKRFREDLYFRITIIPIRLPPLRDRPEDIPLLAQDILRRIALERGRDTIDLDDGAMTMLTHYQWPGNIREMRNVLERAAQIADHNTLTVKDLELQWPNSAPSETRARRWTRALPCAQLELQLHRAGAGGRARINRARSRTAGHFAELALQQGEEQRGGADDVVKSHYCPSPVEDACRLRNKARFDRFEGARL